jgi:hypothetical protein
MRWLLCILTHRSSWGLTFKGRRTSEHRCARCERTWVNFDEVS